MSTNLPRTILGPLTTTFTAAPTCVTPIGGCNTCDNAWQGQQCFSSSISGSTTFGVEDNTACWPPRGSNTVVTPIPPLEGWGFYSPGLICPSGATPACSATAGVVSNWPVQYSMLSGETAVGCCPSGYSCKNDGAQTCISIATSTTFPLASCQSGSILSPQYYTLPVTTASTVITTYSLFAPLIQINWQSSDLPTTTTSATTPATLATLATSATSSTTQTATHVPNHRLSTGAAAGMGVGISLGVIIIALLSIILYRGRKSKYTPAPLHSLPTERLHELGGMRGPYDRSELPLNNGISELSQKDEHKIPRYMSELAGN